MWWLQFNRLRDLCASAERERDFGNSQPEGIWDLCFGRICRSPSRRVLEIAACGAGLPAGRDSGTLRPDRDSFAGT
jgi:hypothetical protein